MPYQPSWSVVPTATEWQTVLQTIPQAHALQSWTWGELKSRWGWTMHTLSLSEGVAALVLKRKTPYLPFSILYLPKGPCFDYQNVPAHSPILAQLEQFARQTKAILLKIDPDVPLYWGIEEEQQADASGHHFQTTLQHRGWQFSNEQIQFRNTVKLDLRPTEETLFANLKQKTRYNIRLAERKEITVRAGTPADFPIMAQLYAETAQRDGFTIRPTSYYLDAWQTFWQAGMGQLLFAEYQGQKIAGIFLVKFGQQAIYMYGASSEQERQRMPNHLLQWEAIRWAKSQGCTIYDFWGAPNQFLETDPLWGVWRFKMGFNGQVVQQLGAWDYPARPFWYRLYTVILPKYVQFLRSQSGTAG